MKKTISAGGVIVKKIGNELSVLLLGTEEGKYLLPKGHVEGSETLEEAALREVEEEAGLSKLKIVRHLGSNQRKVTDKDEFKTIHFFLMFPTVENEENMRTKDNVGLSFDWYPIDGLPEFYLEPQLKVIENNREIIREEYLKKH